MSKLIGGTLRTLGKGAVVLGRGYALKKEEGARFSTKKEVKTIFASSNKGLLIDGVKKRISVQDSMAHVAIVAKTGFGKTTSYIIPNIIDRIDTGDSLVVLDPSRELFHKTSSYAKKKRYTVLLIDPTDPEQVQFNPFYGFGYENISDIRSISSSIILSRYGNDKEPIWNDGAIGLVFFFAKCFAYKGEAITIPKIYSLLLKFGVNGESLGDWVADIDHPENVDDESLAEEWYGIISTQEKMLASYCSVAKTALGCVSEDAVKRVLSGNDVSFLNFRKEKTILYIGFPSHKQKDYQFIIDVLYTRLFSEMMSAIPSKRDLSVYCLLDEFGSSYIKDFQLIATNIRKYKVSLSIVMQSLAQLKSRYGHRAEEIKGGIGSYVIYSGADNLTAKEISETIGKKTIIERNTFTEVVNNRREANLLNPDQIRTLKDNQMVFLSKNRFAIVMDMLPYFKNSRMKRIISD